MKTLKIIVFILIILGLLVSCAPPPVPTEPVQQIKVKNPNYLYSDSRVSVLRVEDAKSNNVCYVTVPVYDNYVSIYCVPNK
jgi:hypothetical protein